MTHVSIDFAGVAYLLYMAWTTLREKGALTVEEDTAPRSAFKGIVYGVLINILNPKLTIFFFAFLPQFVTPGEPGTWLRMVELSAVFMLVTLSSSPATGCSPRRSAGMSSRVREC